MGSILNTVTSPLGVKLFKGGPYADAGKLDQQQQQAAPMAAVGNQFLQQGAGLPGLDQLGLLQYMPQIFSSLSSLTGAQNPLTGQTPGVNKGASGPLMDGKDFGTNQNQTDTSPFALNPVQQAQLNQQNSAEAQNFKNTMARVKANLAARGLTNSSHLASAEAYLRNQMLTRQSQNRAGAGYNAYNTRLDTTNQFGNMLGNLYGQQAQRQGSLVGMGQSLISPQLQNTGAQAQLAQQNSANSMGPLGNILGAYFGGAFNKPHTTNPYLSGNAAGGGVGGAIGSIGSIGGLGGYGGPSENVFSQGALNGWNPFGTLTGR